jgi:hypothetical protein
MRTDSNAVIRRSRHDVRLEGDQAAGDRSGILGLGARPASRLGAALVALSLMLPGCQGGRLPMPFGAPDGETPAEARMREDSSRFNATVLGGTVAGCGIGAVVAALGCKIGGGDARRVRHCAVAGCVVLGAAGAADGYHTAKQQQASRDRVRTTQAMVADVRQDNQKIQAFLESSDKVLADSRARLRQIDAQVAARRISTDQAAVERRRIEQNRDLMQSTLEEMKRSRDVYHEAAKKEPTGAGHRDLDGELNRMDQKIASLERNVRAMNAALGVTRS